MYNIEKIKDLTADEVTIVNDLMSVVNEASEAAELIRKTYHDFEIFQNQIEVWSDPQKKEHEYLTRDGVWYSIKSSEKFGVICSKEKIFQLFETEYLVSRGFIDEFNDDGQYTEEGQRKKAAKAFRKFLNRTTGCCR